MGVFRIEKNRGYTVMSNYHLKDKTLSLKGKGLLSMILSLPDNWNYTTRGLAAICKEGVESIGTTLRELETVGYLDRRQIRDERGRIKDVEYTIYERPKNKNKNPPNGDKPSGDRPNGNGSSGDQTKGEEEAGDKPDKDNPGKDAPDTETPDMELPDTGEPYPETPAQLNTNRSKTHESNTQGLNSYPYQSNQGDGSDGTDRPVRSWDLELMIGHVQADIDYFNLQEEFKHRKAQLDEMVELIAEMRCKQSGTICIGGTQYTADVVRKRFEKIKSRHIRYVAEAINKNKTKIHNIRKYLIAAFFNAPATISNYYQTKINSEDEDEELIEDIE